MHLGGQWNVWSPSGVHGSDQQNNWQPKAICASRNNVLKGYQDPSDFRPNGCKQNLEFKSAIIGCVGEDLDEEAQTGQV